MILSDLYNIKISMIAKTILHIKRTAWYWHKKRHLDQTYQMQDPDTIPTTSGNLIFDKESRNAWGKEDSTFKQWCSLNSMSAL